MSKRFLVVLSLLAPASTLVAQSGGAHGVDLSIGVRASTLGIGGEVAKLIGGHVALRVGANYLDPSINHTQSDISFQAKAKLNAVTGLIDLFPSNRGSFHFTGGIISNPVTLDATGKPTGGTFTINNTEYSSSEVGTLTGSGKYKSILPYAGLGWGTPAATHGALKLVFDLGVAIGKPTVLLNASGTNSQLQTDVAAQQLKTQNDVDKYAKVYPVISLGLVYRF